MDIAYNNDEYGSTSYMRALNLIFLLYGNDKDDDGVAATFHLVQTDQILSIITDNMDIRTAALLHDTIEDHKLTYEDIKAKFGLIIADLVYEVTHVWNGKEWTFPNLKSRDAMLIKFADRLSNISRMNNWADKRKQKYLDKSKFWKG